VKHIQNSVKVTKINDTPFTDIKRSNILGQYHVNLTYGNSS
jgi:hypothetical protein